MGYYINILQEGCQYAFDGKYLEFMQKLDNQYYFYVCEYDEWAFRHIPTTVIVSYTAKELEYIKRVQGGQKKIKLKIIGREKVFPKV